MAESIEEKVEEVPKENSIKDLFVYTDIGNMIIYGAAIGSILVGLRILYNIGTNLDHAPISTNQVLGRSESETYIEREGIKYYSHIDGKKIEDYVNQE